MLVNGGELQVPVEIEPQVLVAPGQDDLLVGRLLAMDDAVFVQVAFPPLPQSLPLPSQRP